ncbi:MAG: hypothetical protein DRP74_03620 [Candidatus Omnitrophota bacterium]|nr:MAG: hypothetical protein DRP74_03620 [Candidatus Omnitrophota bacterium]
MKKIILNNNSKKGEKMNYLRRDWYYGYLWRGIIFLFIFLVVNTLIVLPFLDWALVTNPLREILWCVSWAAFGVSIGLYNSRETNDKRSLENRHYEKYFLFVWGIATLAAFVALGNFKGDTIMSYAAALLTGVVVGFTGDKLGEKLDLVR